MYKTQEAEKKMNLALNRCAIGIIPSEDFIQKGQELAERVMKILRAKSGYAIDRVFYGGSVGKKTTILFSDIDISLFINGELPPFDKVLDKFEDILMTSDGIGVNTDSVRKWPKNLQFDFENGFSVDLLPAANFVTQSGRQLGAEDLAREQQKLVIREIKKDPENHGRFSSSLCQSQIFFVRRQSEFTHRLIRLAKFWLKTLHAESIKMYGIKTVVEIIAVLSAQETPDKSILAAFGKFLDRMAKVDSQQIFFKEMSDGSWTGIDWKTSATRPNACDLPASAKNGENFIVEPANPFNNLAENFKGNETDVANLKKFAGVTRKRLEDPEIRKLNEVDMMFALFRPQPTGLLEHLETQLQAVLREAIPPVVRPVEFLIETRRVTTGQNPEKKLRTPKAKRKEMRPFVDGIGNFVLAGIQSTVANMEKLNLEELQTSVAKVITEDIKREKYTPWGGRGGRHEDCDVTYTIPVTKGQESGSVLVSAKWK